MKIKSQRDFWSGLMFVVAGIGFALGALNYTFGTSAHPGPGYFPFGLGILLALLGALVLFKALTFEVDRGDPIGRWPIRPAVLVLGAVVLFGFALPRLGLTLALPLLVGVSSLASGEFHWKEVAINAIVLAVASWAIFIKGLGLVIPVWPAFLGL